MRCHSCNKFYLGFNKFCNRCRERMAAEEREIEFNNARLRYRERISRRQVESQYSQDTTPDPLLTWLIADSVMDNTPSDSPSHHHSSSHHDSGSSWDSGSSGYDSSSDSGGFDSGGFDGGGCDGGGD